MNAPVDSPVDSPVNQPAARRYAGRGQDNSQPQPGAVKEPYFAAPRLRDAVNAALDLRRPLLIEGEPGTGKTRLAYSVAYELGYPIFAAYIRSTSRARDLLYTFDAVRRLYDLQQDSRVRNRRAKVAKLENYVKFGPLGQAIIRSMEDSPSVVLIDEIDKADLDFPNDLLLELDRLQFSVDEIPDSKPYDALAAGDRKERSAYLPLVLITSNREKELPAPFLRRCLYYYIPFPSPEEMDQILEQHFTKDLKRLYTAALDIFWTLRDRNRFQTRKPPSTSELIDWVTLLEQADISPRQLKAVKKLADLPYREALIKNQSDLEQLQARD